MQATSGRWRPFIPAVRSSDWHVQSRRSQGVDAAHVIPGGFGRRNDGKRSLKAFEPRMCQGRPSTTLSHPLLIAAGLISWSALIRPIPLSNMTCTIDRQSVLVKTCMIDAGMIDHMQWGKLKTTNMTNERRERTIPARRDYAVLLEPHPAQRMLVGQCAHHWR